ncbi:MAG: FixH family protein [Ignavibacteriales bacterium]|nr:MAG: FixH family protein [Ignavibacteriales bacterium]
MKLKFNWGTGIVISMLVFMIATTGMMILFINQKVDLVTDNYYDKELKFQQQIDKVNNTNNLKEKIELKYESQLVRIKFPQSYISLNPAGELFFYRPSDIKKDFKIPLSIDSTGLQVIPFTSHDKGYWKVQLHWSMQSSEYFNELSFLNE